MNKRNFKIWKKGVEDAMRIVGEHIRCPMVEDKVRTEIEIQATVAEQTDTKKLTIAEELYRLLLHPVARKKHKNK
jgi:hypothetical protein